MEKEMLLKSGQHTGGDQLSPSITLQTCWSLLTLIFGDSYKHVSPFSKNIVALDWLWNSSNSFSEFHNSLKLFSSCWLFTSPKSYSDQTGLIHVLGITTPWLFCWLLISFLMLGMSCKPYPTPGLNSSLTF